MSRTVPLLWYLFAVLVATSCSRESASSSKRIDLALADLRRLESALHAFAEDCGRFPPENVGLQALLTDSGMPRWNGPYLKSMPVDSWGSAYHYELRDEVPSLRSAGADRRLFTGDDVYLHSEADQPEAEKGREKGKGEGGRVSHREQEGEEDRGEQRGELNRRPATPCGHRDGHRNEENKEASGDIAPELQRKTGCAMSRVCAGVGRMVTMSACRAGTGWASAT